MAAGSPVVSNFIFSQSGMCGDDHSLASAEADESTAYVQIISFPQSHVVWIWIGNGSVFQQNLAVALINSHHSYKSNTPSRVISSNILSSANPTDEAAVHTKGLAERISKKLGGKPVYLSCNLSSADDGLSNILEKQIMSLIKKNPEIF